MQWAVVPFEEMQLFARKALTFGWGRVFGFLILWFPNLNQLRPLQRLKIMVNICGTTVDKPSRGIHELLMHPLSGEGTNQAMVQIHLAPIAACCLQLQTAASKQYLATRAKPGNIDLTDG